MSSTEDQKSVDFTPNETYTKKTEDDINVVNIPKETLEFVNLGNYRISQSMEHMPLVRIIEVNSISRTVSKKFRTMTFSLLIKATFFPFACTIFYASSMFVAPRTKSCALQV